MINNLPMKDSPLTITFYSKAPMTKERNAIIDDLNVMLNDSGWLVYTEISTNPFDLNMTKYKMKGSDSNAFIITAGIQYMRVSWASNYHAFYWVNRISRGSNDSIVLDIELDILNTLHNGDDTAGSPLYDFNPISSIERQHENRFYAESIETDEPDYKDLSIIVDPIKEGVQVSTYHKATDDIIIEPNSQDELTKLVDITCWYLVYVAGENVTQPIIYLMPDRRTLEYRIRSVKELAGSELMEIDTIDRTNSKIIKIIRLPYCPVSFSEHESLGSTSRLFAGFSSMHPLVNVFKQEGSMQNYILQAYADITKAFTRSFDTRYYKGLEFSNKETIHTDTFDNLLNQLRYINDPKIRSSEFTTDTIVYDSYSIQYHPENYDGVFSPSMSFEYAQSCDCDSSLVFRLSGIGYRAEENYLSIIPSTRKNEIPTFSSDYIDYMRNGYNYDRTKQVMGNVVNLVGAGASLVGSVATANPVGVVGSAMGLTKAISGAISGELDFEKNLNSLKNKAMNIESINDSSLFDFYGQSRAKRVTMRMIYEDNKRWNDIFHYYGYNRGGIMGKPNVTSRLWFNFLKGEIVLQHAGDIPVWMHERVRTAFREGVTYFHSRPYYASKQWDLTQTKENYETNLLNLGD